MPPRGAPWIGSVGHSDHTVETFFALLAREEVVTLVDVRRFPRSHVVHFDKGHLVRTAKDHGVHYLHLAGLGGKRSVPYPDHMRTTEWQRDLDRLRETAMAARHDGGLAAFMCVERDPAACHRRFIADRLERDGWRVRHFLPDPAQTRLF